MRRASWTRHSATSSTRTSRSTTSPRARTSSRSRRTGSTKPTTSSTRWGRRGSARSASSAPPPRSPTRSSTPPGSASATCRSGWTGWSGSASPIAAHARRAYGRRVTPTTAARIADGEDALRRGAWDDARAAFTAVVEAEPSGAAWEGLGWAAWWLSDEALTLRAREAAYRAYRAEGDAGAAGRVAAWLLSDYREFRGEDAVARGWPVRA